ncbi:MAG: sulfite exporter TauE/SafE family protein [Thiolinea sp.]
MDLLSISLTIIAVLIVGISKGGLGGGLGVLGVPIMALVMSPVQAAAIMLPILCVMDLMALKAYWKGWSKLHLIRLLPAAIAGIALGTLSFKYLNDDFIRLLTGLIAIGFALNHWLKPARLIHQKPGVKAGLFWGTTAGFTSFVAHAGGPPVSIYLLPQKLDKSLYQATTVFFFLVVNYVKLIPYAFLNQFNTENINISLLMLPVAAIGIWLGVHIHHKLPDQWFFRIAYVLLFMTGCKLVFDALKGLI